MIKKIKEITAFTAAAVCLCGALFAQEAVPETQAENKVVLSIEEVVDYALKHSLTLKSSDIDLEMKKRADSTSWNTFLPTIQASGTMSRANDYTPGTADILKSTISQAMGGPALPIPTDYDKEEDRWKTIGNVGLSWAFSPAMIASIKMAKVNYETGKISWEQSQKETVLNIKKLYYGIVLQQEALKIQKTSLENARRRMNQAQANFDNGLIPEIQLLQTQVNYENTKPSVDSAEQTLNQSIDTLAFLIGMPVGTKIELSSSIEPVYIDVDTEDLLKKYAENDLSIRALKSQIEAGKIGMTALGLKTWVPAIAVSYAWQPVYIGPDGAWHFYKGLGKDDDWFDNGSLSLTLAWNLTDMLPWSANQQQIKDTKAQITQAKLGLEIMKENQKVQIRKAVDTLVQAESQIANMNRSVELAQKAYDMQWKSYRNGTTELLDLRDAENSLNQAKLGQLQQKMSYISAVMDLENTLNVNLTNAADNSNAK